MKDRSKIKIKKSQLVGIETLEGEPIEYKIERILENKEPVTDGAPEIYTERKAGVQAAYNIRTDRWEVACDAMDVGSANIAAKREEKAEQAKMEIVKDEVKTEEPSKKIVD